QASSLQKSAPEMKLVSFGGWIEIAFCIIIAHFIDDCKRLIGDPLVRFFRRGNMVTFLTGGDDVSYESKSESGTGR
ncbi:MAG TPA: hypothetical protein VJ904_04515, partial [Tichowtungia sp.]|nr:hypothetical protein [Tichowtungia sp.]